MSRTLDKTEKSRSGSEMNFYFDVFVAFLFLNKSYCIRHESSLKYVMNCTSFISRQKQDKC